MTNRPSITIGIPALNEEANIQQLLRSLLSQRGNFDLKEVVVFSDGSTDQTVARAKEVGDNRINVIANEQRVGQAEGQNRIFSIATGDIVILFNGDVLPGNDDFIAETIKHFNDGGKVGMVAPDIKPLPARNFFERAINYSAEFKRDVVNNWKNGQNLYTCHGRVRAFSKELTKKIHWPLSSSEDAFSYLTCITNGFGYVHTVDAFALYRSPNNLKDHLKQSTRFLSGQILMARYFPKSLVKEQYGIPLVTQIKNGLKYLVKNPILFISYLAIYALSVIKSAFKKNDSSLWEISESSKKLQG